jgi:hypothetical protein
VFFFLWTHGTCKTIINTSKNIYGYVSGFAGVSCTPPSRCSTCSKSPPSILRGTVSVDLL